MKFRNATGSDIYIKAVTGENFVAFKIYGRDFGIRYSLTSFITGEIESPEEFTDNIALVREGKNGTVSEGYITVTEKGVTRVIFLRRDKYSPIKKITLKTGGESEEIPENNLPF